MWPFLKKQRSELQEPSQRMRFEELLHGMGDFKDLGVHDIALKFWLPEPAQDALVDLANRQGESMSEMLRHTLSVSGKALFQPLRAALTGELDGPEMAKLLPLIGVVVLATAASGSIRRIAFDPRGRDLVHTEVALHRSVPDHDDAVDQPTASVPQQSV